MEYRKDKSEIEIKGGRGISKEHSVLDGLKTGEIEEFK